MKKRGAGSQGQCPPAFSFSCDNENAQIIKNIDTDVLFVGFPQSSLDKFKVEGSTVEP